MFDLNKSILSWKQNLKLNDSFTNENIDELESHLNEQICDLTESGLNDEEAFWVAQKRIGTIQSLNQEFIKINKLNIFKKKVHWMLTGIVLMILYIFFVDSISNTISSIGLLYKFNLITVTYVNYFINEVLFILLASFLIWLFTVEKGKNIELIGNKINSLFNNSKFARITILLFIFSIIGFFFLTFYFRSNLNISLVQSDYYSEYKDLVRFLGQVLLAFHSVVMIIIYYFSFKSNKKLNLSTD